MLGQKRSRPKLGVKEQLHSGDNYRGILVQKDNARLESHVSYLGLACALVLTPMRSEVCFSVALRRSP